MLWSESAASEAGALLVPWCFVYGDDMKRIDRVGNPFRVYRHHRLGMQRDEVAMRHEEGSPIGQLKSEWMETVLKSVSDLIHDHMLKLVLARHAFKLVYRTAAVCFHACVLG